MCCNFVTFYTGPPNAPSAEAGAPVETARETTTGERAVASSVAAVVTSPESAAEEDVAAEAAATLTDRTAEEDVDTQEIGEDVPQAAGTTAGDAQARAGVAQEEAGAIRLEVTDQREEETAATEAEAPMVKDVEEEATPQEEAAVLVELLRRGEVATGPAPDQAPSRGAQEVLTAGKKGTREVPLPELTTQRLTAPMKSQMAFKKTEILKTRMTLRSQRLLTMIETDLRQAILN